MDRKTLDKVNRGTEQDKPFTSIGITNIRERIRLQFGERAILVYSGGKGMATVAYLRFPVRQYQQGQ
jgi:sensor histidine kinase YesM